MLPIRYYVTNRMLVTDRSRCNLGGQSFLSFRYFRISIIRRIMSTASADNAHTSIIVIRILHLPPERILRGKEETSPPTVRVFNSYGCFSFGTMYRFNYTFSNFHCQITFWLQKYLSNQIKPTPENRRNKKAEICKKIHTYGSGKGALCIVTSAEF